jgi:hypothetical protein
MSVPEEKPRSADPTGGAKEERGKEGSRARRIAEPAPERTASPADRARATSAEAPEERTSPAIAEDPDVDRALD